MWIPIIRVANALALALLAACGGAAGATPAQMTEAKGQSSTGALLYERSCESCHGENGAGTKRGPAVLGAETLANSRFTTAEDLFEYVAREMPKDSPGSLDFTQYWNIVTFMAASTGQKIPDDRLSESNAAQVRFSE